MATSRRTTRQGTEQRVSLNPEKEPARLARIANVRPTASFHQTAALPRLYVPPRFPYLFAWPLPGPLERHERIVRRRVGGWAYLEQILDAEARGPQPADPIAVR